MCVVDAGGVSAAISSASGGNFENLVVNAGAGDDRHHRHDRHHDGVADGQCQRRRRRQHRLHMASLTSARRRRR